MLPRFLLTITGLVGCANSDPEPTDPPFDVAETLRAFLVGEFDSSAQAERNPEYFSIQLVTCDVSAPELGQRVVYVEQAVIDTPAEPYRQRLYAISGDAGSNQASTEVYTLGDEAAAIGLCGRANPASFTKADTALRAGCGVEVTWNAETATFTGGTVGTNCASDLSGASYATSEVTIADDRVDSWDRGYDAAGEQVWGAVAGPYRFRRR